eukprot:XP_011601790.1 PREDICTED: uncharacterized protein LOC101066561 isoform X2 [Takifugu rubripes]
MASVRVAVRVRPLNKREKELSSIINIMGNTASVSKPSSAPPGHELKVFSYDFSYDSTDKESLTFASQEKIYNDLGPDVLKAAFKGVNACVLAYGQTGSGKTYTMMGHPDDKGIIPRLCEGLYGEMDQRKSSDTVSFCTEVSYVEIYNERVRDLLKKKAANGDGGLRVREHPLDGPYVENLSKCLVANHNDMEALMALGNAHRSTGSTGMNHTSSRSHAIFTIRFSQAWFDAALPHKTLSKIHLVDLAGSERADVASTSGTRLKEGASINKSLVTLGSVISTLAEVGVRGASTKKKQVFIPYRDSVLTWLLKDSLGGNSVTTMIATVSPAAVNYGETLSTLRYASRAKNIVNCPTVNEDHGGKLIRELRAEVTRLQRLLKEANQIRHWWLSSTKQTELLRTDGKVPAPVKESNKRSQRISQGETQTLEEGSGFLNCHLPHLIGVNEDLLSDRLILYYLKEGRTLIGADEASCRADIVLHGPGVLGEHCVLENLAGTVTLIPKEGALCSVNGSVVTGPSQLTQGDSIQLGPVTTLRFIQPSRVVQLGEHDDEHPAFYSSAYIYKFMEHLVKKMLPKIHVQGGLLSALCPSLTDGSKSAEEEWTPRTSGLDEDLDGMVNSSAVTAIPGEYPIPHNSFQLDEDSQRGGVSTGEGQKEGALCHKSEPGLVSERPQEAQSVAERASYEGEQVWSGDASLQQTSVLGLGDGCGAKPEGNANKIQDAMADCSEGRPGSGESSLGKMSLLQSNGGSPSTTLLPQTSARARPDKECSRGDFSTPEKPSSKAQFFSAATDGMASLVSKVSWITKDAEGLFWVFSMLLQQVGKEGLALVWACWSGHVLPLLRERKMVSVVMESDVITVIKANVCSLFNDAKIVSVKDLPLVQLITMALRRSSPSGKMFRIFQDYVNSRCTSLRGLALGRNKEEEMPAASLNSGDVPTNGGFPSPCWQNVADLHNRMIREGLQAPASGVPEICYAHADKRTPGENWSVQSMEGVRRDQQRLMEFPDSLLSLQTLPLPALMEALQPLIPTASFNSRKIAAVYWLSVGKCGQAEPSPALLVLLETSLYTVTIDSGLLVLFCEQPLLELREVQISLAGQSLALMGATGGSSLHVYTYSEKLTKDLCCAILGVTHPGDDGVSQHPLLTGDLMQMSLDWTIGVAELQLDDGFRVGCTFQRSLVDLSYLLYQNMDQETIVLGDVRLLFYTTVAVCLGSRSKRLAQLVLTDTHLGLLQEAPCSGPAVPCRSRFHDLTLRRRSGVRCVVVHGEEASAVRLDVILANAKVGGHQESVTEAATPSVHILDSSPHAEVWKLTFSCSSEAACLINHLSNV